MRVYVFGEKDRMGSSLEGRPEKRSCARLWMKKLNLVATLPRLDSINLGEGERRRRKRAERVRRQRGGRGDGDERGRGRKREKKEGTAH